MFEKVPEYFINFFLIAERKVTGDISQTGVYTVGNNMFLLPKHGSLISLNSKGKKNLIYFFSAKN